MIKAIALDFGSTLYQIKARPESVRLQGHKLLQDFLRLDDKTFSQFLEYLGKAFNYRKEENLKHSLIEYSALHCFKEALKKMGIPSSDSDLSPIIDEYFNLELDYITPIGNAIGVVKKLCDTNYPLALVTNNPWHNIILSTLKRDKIDTCFEFIISSSIMGFRKPAPQVFNKLLENWNQFQPDEILFVGDDLINDIEAAKIFKMKTFHVTSNSPLENLLTPITI